MLHRGEHHVQHRRKRPARKAREQKEDPLREYEKTEKRRTAERTGHEVVDAKRAQHPLAGREEAVARERADIARPAGEAGPPARAPERHGADHDADRHLSDRERENSVAAKQHGEADRGPRPGPRRRPQGDETEAHRTDDHRRGHHRDKLEGHLEGEKGG